MLSSLTITLIILFCTILAFLSGKVPMSLTSMGIILALILTKVMSPAQAFSGFINTNVIMFAGMFVIGAAITKTSIIKRSQSLVERYRDNRSKLILIACLAATLLSILTSATAAIAILLPLLIAIVNDVDISRSKILYPVAVVANIATATTFLGIGSANMAWSSVMIKAGGKTPLQLWDFTIVKLPILIVSIIYMAYIAPKLLPNHDNNLFEDHLTKKNVDTQLSPRKEKIAIAIILLTIIFMVLSSYIGVELYIISTIGACLLVICGVLNEKEALSSINLPTIFLFGGVLVLSDALTKTGAGSVIANWMSTLIGNNTNQFLIAAVFFGAPFILTQFMSNLATVAIFAPLVATASVNLGLDPRAAVLAAVTASSCSFLTPLASPAQTMIMEPGGYNLWNYIKAGFPLAVIIMVLGSLIPLIYPMN
ncbi:SLC13 family permease [Oenococcus oeni]